MIFWVSLSVVVFISIIGFMFDYYQLKKDEEEILTWHEK